MKNWLAVAMILIAGLAGAQVSINGGGSMLVGFSSPGPWGGIHIGLEVPRDDAVSIYGRFTHHFRAGGDSVAAFVTARDVNTLPANMPFSYAIGSRPTMDYNILEGGTRYYLGNGFDYGFAAYGGSCIMLIFNSVKAKYDDYDETIYQLDDGYRYDGSIFSLAFGLGGGVKYSAARFGTFYLDVNLAYTIFGQANNSSVYGGLYNLLIFNFNLGYRKDILW